jgi:hypothetical protein
VETGSTRANRGRIPRYDERHLDPGDMNGNASKGEGNRLLYMSQKGATQSTILEGSVFEETTLRPEKSDWKLNIDGSTA